jgi:hypothetical protein
MPQFGSLLLLWHVGCCVLFAASNRSFDGGTMHSSDALQYIDVSGSVEVQEILVEMLIDQRGYRERGGYPDHIAVEGSVEQRFRPHGPSPLANSQLNAISGIVPFSILWER